MELLKCQREVWIVELPQHDLTILLHFKFRGIREYTHWRLQAQKRQRNDIQFFAEKGLQSVCDKQNIALPVQ